MKKTAHMDYLHPNRRQVLIPGLAGVAASLLTSDKSFANKPHKSEVMLKSAVSPEETFENSWPFQAHYTDLPGYPAHYIDEGEGPETLLLLHGEPTWSYLFRKQIKVWREHFRVIAIDHMGFGKSATPQNRTYWLQDHIDNLEKVVVGLRLKKLTLVMHDFGGPVGMGLAIRRPELIRRIVSVNGPTPLGQADLIPHLIANAETAPWFNWIARAHENGTLETVLGNLNYNILSTLKLNGFVNNDLITDTWLRAYGTPFTSPNHAIGAIGWASGFAQNLHQFEIPDSAAKQALSAKPALAIWGTKDQTLQSRYFLPLFKSAFPDGDVLTVSNAGHYSPEDAPDIVARLVIEFIKMRKGLV